ncbi:MAG: HEPN domain-containing protein, partial [Spirochaetales bacterium]|nr:HEPN domain-containing protein [Spirochaetales bacterium]
MDEKLEKLLSFWKIKADNDIKTIENELKSEEPVTDSICYHSQQAAEKYLKLFLVSEGIEPARSHNIAFLKNECEKNNSAFSKLTDIEYLTDYAVDLRYPDNFYIPSLEEAKDAYSDT